MKIIIPVLIALLLTGGKPYERIAINLIYDFFSVYMEPEPETENLPPRRESAYAEFFERIAEQEMVPVSILESVALAESRFRPWAMSPIRSDGFRDLGMFQINERYLEWYANKYNMAVMFDPLDYRIATVIAARHLRAMKEMFGSWEYAVISYNCGASRVKTGTIPASTVRYFEKVWNDN